MTLIGEHPVDDEVYRVGDLCIDAGRRQITRNGIELPVPNLSFELLLALVRAYPRVVTTEALLDSVWAPAVVNPETVAQRVKLLRQALGNAPGAARYVVSVRGRGYRLDAPVTRVQRELVGAALGAPQSLAASTTVEIVSPGSLSAGVFSKRRVRWVLTGACVLGLSWLGQLAWHALTNRSLVGPQAAAVAPSIAVLPFTNLTGDPSKDYLGEGMSEEIIDKLTQVRGLRVSSRTSTFAYKGRTVDVRQIAHDLGVSAVLEGSVRAASERIRISAQLINARDGMHIWSKSYDQRFTDLFNLQDDLAQSIVQALRASLVADLPDVQASAPTRNLEAYDLYLQAVGIQSLNTEAAQRDSLRLLQQALTIDPKFARAWAASAGTRLTLVASGFPLANAIEDAEREAARALTLDAKNTQSYAALGWIAFYRGDWLEAESRFRHAILIDPRDPVTHSVYGVSLLMNVGQMHGAIEELNEAYRLAPADRSNAALLALAYSVAGHDSEALAFRSLALQLGSIPETEPLTTVYFTAARRAGRIAEVTGLFTASLPLAVRTTRDVHDVELMYLGIQDPTHRSDGVQAARRLVQRVASNNTRYRYVPTFAMLGDLDDAFALANQIVAQTSGTAGTNWSVLWLPEMRLFRQDPRFQSLVTRLKFTDYWKEHGPPDDCLVNAGVLACR